jgi:hypothetical protein
MMTLLLLSDSWEGKVEEEIRRFTRQALFVYFVFCVSSCLFDSFIFIFAFIGRQSLFVPFL